MPKRYTLEELFPVPEEDNFSEASIARMHNWHHETLGNLHFHICKECEIVKMSIDYEVDKAYSNWDQTTEFVLRKANKGFICSQTL